MNLKLCRGKESNYPLVAKFITEQKPNEVKSFSLLGVTTLISQCPLVLFLKDAETQEIQSVLFTSKNFVRLIIKNPTKVNLLIEKFKHIAKKESLTSWNVVCDTNTSEVERSVWEKAGAIVESAILSFNFGEKQNDVTGVSGMEQTDSKVS
jgi:hypothetical protein